MSSEIVLRREISPSAFALAQQMAMAVHKWYGVTEYGALATMIMAYELGLPFTTGFQFIHVIEGKPTLSPRGHLSLLHASGLFVPPKGLIDVRHLHDDKGRYVGCECTLKRADTGFQFTGRWTMDDAAKAGLIRKDSGWEKYPQQMCQWRAIGYAADVVAPDIGGGLKRADEFGADISPEGEVLTTSTLDPEVIEGLLVETGYTSPEATDPEVPVADEDLVPALQRLVQDALINSISPMDLMTWNEGKMPETLAEVKQLQAKLADEVVRRANSDLYGD